ncbi:DUF5009 domain-containing protein [Parapedobacter sp. 10938]|uniref:DUF5009 domain-containing protein n=1 Tax=Parapedobacter flavus TaxID=3110225 RepID=UPI002DB720C6|nr:DUF5009 domain-containing protein [Parapedobacter sp. 10938]MEC3879301.1 DUF5009 domain-containing protein [Parapedobacter sp. 10938]
MSTPPPSRLLSIDAYRALVMLLMIFVNDTWTLMGIPGWIEHLPAEADGLGLADVVFPAFLFIVGLSVPLAIQSRLKKGDSRWHITGHVVVRSLALLIMGVFHVNLAHYADTAWLPKWLWQIAITVGFFLVWLDYPAPRSTKARVLKTLGIVGLAALALLFQTDGGNAGSWLALRPHWWGILGLIGWCYLLVSLLFLWTRGNPWAQVGVFVGFILFNMGAQSTFFDGLEPIRAWVWIVGDGALPALTACGVLLSLLYRRYKAQLPAFMGRAAMIAVALLALGFLARQEWNISKIWATPSFALICAGISVAAFALMVYIVDIKHWAGWYRFISPAGTSTLTCYLLPYIHYALLGYVGWQLPEVFRTGAVGVAKSLLYALVIIAITGLLEKRRIRLKL